MTLWNMVQYIWLKIKPILEEHITPQEWKNTDLFEVACVSDLNIIDINYRLSNLFIMQK
jgi:hypothetical protein